MPLPAAAAFIPTMPGPLHRHFERSEKSLFVPGLVAATLCRHVRSGGSVANVQTGGVAYMAHIGGMIFGALTARLSIVNALLNNEFFSPRCLAVLSINLTSKCSSEFPKNA